MNKRIEQLAELCTIECRDGNGGYIEQVDTDKFAELIVQECIKVLTRRYMGDNNREDFEVRRCIDDVKKHFGVE